MTLTAKVQPDGTIDVITTTGATVVKGLTFEEALAAADELILAARRLRARALSTRGMGRTTGSMAI